MPNVSTIPNVHRQAASGVAWMASTTFVWQLLSWALTLVTARILSPSDYGVLAMSQLIFPYVGMLASFRISEWVCQAKTFGQDEEATALRLSLLLGTAAFVLAYFGSYAIAWFYGEPRALVPFQISSIVFLFIALRAVPDGKLRRQMRFRTIATVNLVVSLVQGGLQIALAMHGWAYWALVLGGVVREVALTVVFCCVARPSFSGRWRWESSKNALRFGFHATLNTVFWVIYSTADNIAVGRLFGPEVLGYYYMAFFLADLPYSKLNSVITPVLVPYFGRIKESPEQLRRAFGMINSVMVSIVCPVLLGAAVAAPVLIPLLLGETWVNVIPIFQVLCVAGILRALTAAVSPLCLALGQPQRLSNISMAVALVLPISFFALGYASRPALWGIYVTWILVFPLIGTLPMLRLCHRLGVIEPGHFVKNLLLPMAASILAASCAYLVMSRLPDVAVLQLVVGALVGFLMYVLAMYILFRDQLASFLRMASPSLPRWAQSVGQLMLRGSRTGA